MSATVIILLCALMCPLSMGLMMLFMRNGHGHSSGEQPRRAGDDRDERAD
jgi:hypothetical protein